MNLRFINITAKAGDNETMSNKDNLHHHTPEARPHNGGHGSSHNDDEDDWPWSKGPDGIGEDAWCGGNGENGDWEENCCDSLAMGWGCVIQDDDPRVHYGGPWKHNEIPTSHSTVAEGSTLSLIFNGKFYQCSLRDPGIQWTLQAALSLSLAQSRQAISPSRRQLHTSLIHCLPLSRHYPKQPLIFLISLFILFMICHWMKNTDSLSMSLKSSLRHRMLWLAFPFAPYLVPEVANPLRLLLQRLLLQRLLLQRLQYPQVL